MHIRTCACRVLAQEPWLNHGCTMEQDTVDKSSSGLGGENVPHILAEPLKITLRLHMLPNDVNVLPVLSRTRRIPSPFHTKSYLMLSLGAGKIATFLACVVSMCSKHFAC